MKLNYLRSNKGTIGFTLSLALIGIIIGILLFTNQSSDVSSGVANELSNLTETIKTTNQNNILFHLAVLSISLILSITVIGIPIIMFYYFYEFVSIGYLLSSFYAYKKINGVLFGSIFVLINKILFLLFLTYFIISSFKYAKKFIYNLKGGKSSLIVNMLYKGLFVIFLTIISDTILYFVGNKLLGIFTFLL